ncbi:hypothetical protein BJX99DRAFT_172275 [Aspergillus californicus]
MPPKSQHGQQFMFVGGPTLNTQAGNVRSTLLRRVLGEKKKQRRQDAAGRLDSMLRRDGEDARNPASAMCSCLLGQGSAGPDSLDAAAHRMIRPRGANVGGSLSGRCPTCGGFTRGDSKPPSPGPQLLGARADPLLPVDATSVRLKVHELLDFSATTIWPHFRSVEYAGNCYKAWIFPFDNNLSVYAVLWAASYHRDILRVTYGAAEPCLDSREQLELKSLALQALQKEVANVTETTAPDALVMCILYLAVNDKHKAKITRDASPFSPPFTNLQALDFYGSRDFHPLHWDVVQHIVRRFGGIQNLRAFALAWLLSLSDLMNAVHTLSKPIYPIVDVWGSPLDLQPPGLLFKPPPSRPVPGSGFHDLFYLWPPIKQIIVPVFVHLGELCAVLQHYAEGSCSPAVLDLLGDSRNLVHHRLLSLPNEEDPIDLILACKDGSTQENELSREIYLVCRLSALLYAIHVTFPLPRSQQLRHRILHALHPRISRLAAQNVTRPSLLWCVAVTLSVCDECPGTKAYMTRLLHTTGVDTEPKLLALLRSFAWVDAAVQGSWTQCFSFASMASEYSRGQAE